MTTKTKRFLGHLLIGLLLAALFGIIGWVFATAIADECGIALVYSCLVMAGCYGLVVGLVFLLKYLLAE